MQTRGGILATNAMVRPKSSGCSIFACSFSKGTTGRNFRPHHHPPAVCRERLRTRLANPAAAAGHPGHGFFVLPCHLFSVA
jgi:hypothetical protein